MRVQNHPILGVLHEVREVALVVDGVRIAAREGETIAAALAAAGIRIHRYTPKQSTPRGVFCAIGQCTDCAMTVNGRPNVRTCMTRAANEMIIETPNQSQGRLD